MNILHALHHINTGYIYRSLKKLEGSHTRDFISTVETNIFDLLTEKNIVEYKFKEEEKEYFYRKEAYLANLSPSTVFYGYIITAKLYIYNFSSSCPLTSEDLHFTSFFALQLSITDIEKINDFMYYHFKVTFNENIDDLSEFIELIFDKYETIFESTPHQKKYTHKFLSKSQIIIDRLDKKYNDDEEEDYEDDDDLPLENNKIGTELKKDNLQLQIASNVETTLMIEGENQKENDTFEKQLIAIHYLLKHIKSEPFTREEYDKLLAFLTNKKIENVSHLKSEIYTFEDPLVEIGIFLREENIVHIAEFYDKIGLNEISLEIQKDLTNHQFHSNEEVISTNLEKEKDYSRAHQTMFFKFLIHDFKISHNSKYELIHLILNTALKSKKPGSSYISTLYSSGFEKLDNQKQMEHLVTVKPYLKLISSKYSNVLEKDLEDLRRKIFKKNNK
jgi:hypothetical protein